MADFLGVGGIEIKVKRDTRDLPSPSGDLDLGTPVTLLEAELSVPFELRTPVALGEPDGVYIADFPQADVVTFVYGEPDEPELLLSQFLAEVDIGLVDKQVQMGIPIEPVTIDGEPGYWVGGEHNLLFTSPEGDVYESESRLAGNTLVWTSEGITFRLEGELTKAEALEIARSL